MYFHVIFFFFLCGINSNNTALIEVQRMTCVYKTCMSLCHAGFMKQLFPLLCLPLFFI